MLLPVSWAAAFLFSVLNMHYPALASAPGALLAGGRRQVVPVLCGPCGNSGKKKTRTAPLAESSQKIILFDYRVSIPRAARMCKRSFAILFGGFLAS